ncbi:hypothetical protein FACS189429_0840 [Bacteroidia bacterium]|nr:hypothetical protein FACS189429_0840 [Bacteroidia bacterium]
MDFENVENGKPTGWQVNGGQNYKFSLDSSIVQNGKYSATLEYTEGEPNFIVLGKFLFEKFEGKTITLSGYLKTENIEGYASILMRIDPEVAVNEVKVTGTVDWTKYEITLNMNPKQTRDYALGIVLNGKGKVWVDNLKISVDGKDISELKTGQGVLTVQENNEFENGSNISIEQLNNTSIENLSTLGLVWGFLKYYHPNVTKGNYNWDYELFKILPLILNSKNKVERDKILIKWISDLGQFSKNTEKIQTNSEIKIKPDLDWITNSGFSNELSSLLLNVKNAKRTEQSYYVGCQLGGNPEFKNENSYSDMVYPDAGFRLLALYRYWNIIQYYFPYKNLIEEDWKNVLKEFIPKMVNVNNETEYTLVVLELIGRIHDTHANILGNNPILTNYFGERHAPVELTFIENKPLVTGFYDKKLGKSTGLEIGDVLTKINHASVTKIIENNLKYTPAANYTTQLRDIASNLLRTNESVIHVEFVRNGKIQSKAIKTYSDTEMSIPVKYLVTDTCFKLINKDIAYINNGSLKKAYLPKIWKEIRNTKGLIIDARNYPSDYPIYDLCDYLMPDATLFTKFTVGSIVVPGLFIFSEAVSAGKKNDDFYQGKVIILVNELTQSSAEFHVMAYKVHPNATVIGSTTAGTDGNMSFFNLPGGISTAISGIGIYYPDGRETQRTGIVPDIEIKPTIKGIKENRDEVLEKAIEIINHVKQTM